MEPTRLTVWCGPVAEAHGFLGKQNNMQCFTTRLIVATITFFIGIATATVWFSNRRDSPLSQSTTPVSSPPCSLSPSDKKIGEAEAVRLAECLVIGNGYTALAPMEDRSKLSYESWADGPPAEEALEKRHNTIESKAYGVMKGGRAKDGWAIIFRYNLSNETFSRFRPDTLDHFKTVGRGVTMDAYGGNMRVEHEDFTLSQSQKIEDVAH